MADECSVCGGEGYYPIINMRGTEVYSIRCPECYGTGKEYTDQPEEQPDLPPKSSAASVQSIGDMQEHVRTFWSAPVPANERQP